MNAAILDFTQPPGFTEFTGLDPDFLTQNRLLVCATIAIMYSNPGEGASNAVSASVAVMALYAGGAQVKLNTQQFRALERRVKRYIVMMRERFGQQSMNFAMARFVLNHGVERAKAENIIGTKRESE